MALWVGTGLSAADSPGPSATLQPAEVTQGQSSLLRITPNGGPLPAGLTATAGEVTLALFPCPLATGASCALVPVPLETAPGDLSIVLSWGNGEARSTRTVALRVRKAKHHETRMNVDPDRVHPTPEEQKRIDEEKKETEAAYAHPIGLPVGHEPLTLPESGSVTSLFGNRRSFNGELKSVHMGEDLRAAMRTPIQAIGDGTVVLAKDMFYAGQVVILDHGGGIFSSYAHLSAILVKPGQTVKQGDRIGLSGATGRVTGPHLHWGMRINGIPVEPRQAHDAFNLMWTSD